MRISFSMDGVKNMDELYTYTVEKDRWGEDIATEHYCGDDYCEKIVKSVWDSLSAADWKHYKYIGSRDRIANETFILTAADDSQYQVSFAINTYRGKAARLEITLVAMETDTYDHRLESLKIALKNFLLPNWNQCTWLLDEQSAALCKEAYEKAFAVENTLRAFVSKVLIHFLGVNWLRKAGLEKNAASVDSLKGKFTQRVPEFDNINTDFLSMTLETLTSVVFQGIIYEDEIILSRNDYLQIQEMKEKGNIADFIKKRRSVYKRIWEDLFVPYVDDPAAFKAAVHNFIEDRNHIAHSKVLSWNAYQITLGDFSAITNLITSANTKFEQDETSDEVALTLEIEMEESQYDNEDYLRDRLSSETGIDILDEEEIKDWFDEVFHELYNSVYQQYHLDVCYDISDLSSNIGDLGFTISSPAVEDGSAKLKIIAEYSIDDDLGSDSTCEICVKRERGDEVCKAQIRFHNGDGYENEEGLMEAADSSEYDTVELDDLKEELFAAIESLNPYPEQLSTLVLENKGAVQFVGDCPCEQCGKCGVSINPDFLPIGKCCYCGFENEMVVCERCGELVNAVIAEQGFCPSCAACIEQQ